MVCYWYTSQHAGSICGFPARQHQRTHGSTRSVISHVFPIRLLITKCSGVFGLLQIVAFGQLVRSHVSSQQFQKLLVAAVISIGVLGAVAFAGLTYKGWIAPWTGRFYSLWDTGYAKK